MKCTLDRRSFLELAAVAAGLAFVPALGREARAALRPGAPTGRVLIVNLNGGVRTSASFLASRQVKYNPWGLMDGAPAAFPLGRLLDDHLNGETPPADAEYTLGAAWKNERTPRFREIGSALSLIGTWDAERGDHVRARLKEPTGSTAGDQPGLLTRLATALTNERGPLDVPPFQLQPFAAFGDAGNYAQFVPVSLGGPQSLPVTTSQSAGERALTGNDWARNDAMRERYDQRVIARRARNAKTLADVFAVHRRASRRVGARLAEPWLNVANQDPTYQNAAFGTVRLGGGEVPLTNAMLYELFTKTLGVPDPTSHMAFGSAMNAALSLRLLQLGSPAVCLEISSFDFHSQERTQAPPLYRFLGRALASLAWVMQRMPDPLAPGRSLFDTTMVITMSDFSRDPGSPATGYNGGEGSDHGNDASCYYLGHAVMGGGVRPARFVNQVSTDDYRGDRSPDKFDQRALIAMVMWSLGLDPKHPEWGFDDVTAPLDILFRA